MQNELAHEDIACRAFELYTQRQGEQGNDVDDWLQAEKELHQKPQNEQVSSRPFTEAEKSFVAQATR
jgi:hypothetical protein